MAWCPGPLPPDTYYWGAVILVGEDMRGFHFADFHGDHVRTYPDGERIEPAEVAWYDNGLRLPVEGNMETT